MAVEALHLELLHACPLKCLACDHRALGAGRLSARRIKAVFSAGEFRNLRLVSFSGGEPLLHPGLAGIVSQAASAFPAAALVVLTSLYDTGKLDRFLRALPAGPRGRLHLGSSLDGPPAVHDEMRGRAGAFDGLKASVRSARKTFPFLSIGCTFTATSRNAAFFYEAWLEARRTLNVPLGIQFLVPNANTAGLELTAADRKALAAGIKAALSGLGKESRRNPGGEANLKAALKFLDGGTPAGVCGAGKTFLMLSPDGLFYLCPFHKEVTAPLPEIASLRGRLKAAALKDCSVCFLRCAQIV
ncbi:MAG: hypothetical protein A2X28_02970 [Elusimicrobia bacterium GWA2_56_46]|nr:MAG: hypothetical protein A2X28_02970 [Elusimicrobia bacterium GWA2_56_46]OGR54191.1 MAG: hypothetical protein A2X39_08915 [Elusimicrobia bacterium GWC2_56_31]HBB68258.1 hypothetical protein [Elusimicrobiota bacterium]HBW21768.1 hypothetical protein [Elusimicrobiota bacterium]